MNRIRNNFNIFIFFKYKKIILFFLIILFIIYSFIWIYIAENIKLSLNQINSEKYNISFNDVKIYGYPFSHKIKSNKFELYSPNYPNIKWVSDNLYGYTKFFDSFNFNLNFNKNKIKVLSMNTNEFMIEAYIEKIFVNFEDMNITNSNNIKFNFKDIKFNLIKKNSNFIIDNLNIFIEKKEILNQKKNFLININLDNLIGKNKLFQIIDAPIKLSEAKIAVPSLNNEFNINQWQKSGGVLNFQVKKFEWGKIKLDSYGTFSVDTKMKPIGTLTLNIQNINYLINSLQNSEVVSPMQGSIIKIALKLFSSRIDKDKIRIPITVQSDNISIGSLKVSESFFPSIAPYISK